MEQLEQKPENAKNTPIPGYTLDVCDGGSSSREKFCSGFHTLSRNAWVEVSWSPPNVPGSNQ